MKNFFVIFFSLIFLIIIPFLSSSVSVVDGEEKAIEERMEDLERIITIKEKLEMLTERLQGIEVSPELDIENRLASLKNRLQILMERISENLGRRPYQLEEPLIYVTSPSGGEGINEGDTYKVEWSSVGVKNVKISICNADDASNECWYLLRNIRNSIPAEPGYYEWKVELEYPWFSEQAYLRIEDTETDTYGESGNFQVLEKEDFSEEKDNLRRRIQCLSDRLGAQHYAGGRSCQEMSVEMDCRGWGVSTYVTQNDCEISFLEERGWTEVIGEDDEDKEKSIVISNPSRNDVWEEGKRYSIRWSSKNIDKLGIYLTNYSCSTETPKLIATGVDASSGRYTYRIPSDFFSSKDGYCHLRDDYKGWQSGDRFKLFVTELNNYENGSYTDFGHQVESDYFRIVEKAEEDEDEEKELLEKRMQCLSDRLAAQHYAEGRSCQEMSVEMDCRGWGVSTYVTQNDCEVEFLSERGWVMELEEIVFPPEIETLAPANIGMETARIGGRITDFKGELSVDAYWRYGISRSNLNQETTRRTVSSNISRDQYIRIDNLNPGTTYYYRFFAANEGGESKGSLRTLRTQEDVDIRKPEVETLSPTIHSGEKVSLRGRISDLGGADEIDVWFEWGEGRETNNKMSKIVFRDTTRWGRPLEELTSGTGYSYRIVAENKAGIFYGHIERFNTPDISDDEMERLEKQLHCLSDRLAAQHYAEGRSCQEMSVEMDCRGWGVSTYVTQNDCEVEFLSERGWVMELEELSLTQSFREIVNRFTLLLGSVSDHIFAEISRAPEK